MKKILIHSLTFPPDTISTGMIVSEIADGLNKELNNIEVLLSSTIIVTDISDIDPLETKEWIDSLNAVVNNNGNERAHYLLRQLIDESYRKGSRIPFIQNTPYINTIPPEEEEKSPGDQILVFPNYECLLSTN